MKTILNYEDSLIKGHLEVVKVYNDGREEVHFSDDNVITSGLGYTLLKAFSTSGAGNLSSYQISYFQLGASGHSAIQISSTGELSAAFGAADYTTPNFEISTHDLMSSNPMTNNAVFGIIPFPYIKKISPTRVMYQIFIGEQACNTKTISEVGLFSRNPNISVTEGSYLCAYRYFNALTKQDDFSILIRWTIEF